MANLSTLKQVGELLAEIHGQNDHQLLTNPACQLALLDGYAKNKDQQQRYFAWYQKRADLLKEIDALKRGGGDQGHREEMLRYQLAEIVTADFKPDEEAALEQEERYLKNWESILTFAQGGYNALSDEGGILSGLGAIDQQLKNLHQVTQDAQGEIDLLETARIHLKELALLLRDRSGGVSYNPDRQTQIAERLYLIQKMKKKYGGSIPEILQAAERIELELTRLATRATRFSALEAALKETTEALTKSAEALSMDRKAAIGPLQKKVKEELNGLGMGQTRFDISTQAKPFAEDGGDEIDFLIALPGEPFKPIAKVASGGELSRLMLALKVALTEVDPTPTLVFDEVDSGVGGAVAEQIGRRLARLSRRHQVFCITHLPQVARFADHHYRVQKQVSDNRVAVSVHKLTQEERVSELARMLGGKTITAATRRHAEELIHDTSHGG
jgi:DNA repair protein RecN (Recombination protein N)